MATLEERVTRIEEVLPTLVTKDEMNARFDALEAKMDARFEAQTKALLEAIERGPRTSY